MDFAPGLPGMPASWPQVYHPKPLGAIKIVLGEGTVLIREGKLVCTVKGTAMLADDCRPSS